MRSLVVCQERENSEVMESLTSALTVRAARRNESAVRRARCNGRLSMRRLLSISKKLFCVAMDVVGESSLEKCDYKCIISLSYISVIKTML